MSTFSETVRSARGEISREMFGRMINYSPSIIEKVEKGAGASPEFALSIKKATKKRYVIKAYCRECCAIGRETAHEVLNNIDTHPMAIVTKLEEEVIEIVPLMKGLKTLLLNKKGREDFSPAELERLENKIQELLHVDHVIDILLENLNDWVDITKQIQIHRSRCFEKRYIVTKEKTPTSLPANVRVSYRG